MKIERNRDAPFLIRGFGLKGCERSMSAQLIRKYLVRKKGNNRSGELACPRIDPGARWIEGIAAQESEAALRQTAPAIHGRSRARGFTVIEGDFEH